MEDDCEIKKNVDDKKEKVRPARMQVLASIYERGGRACDCTSLSSCTNIPLYKLRDIRAPGTNSARLDNCDAT